MLKNEIVLYEKMRKELDNLLKQRKLTKDPKIAEKLLHRSTNGDNFQSNSNFEPYNTLQRIEDEREKLREKKELIVKLRENKLYKASKSAEMVRIFIKHNMSNSNLIFICCYYYNRQFQILLLMKKDKFPILLKIKIMMTIHQMNHLRHQYLYLRI